MKEGGEYVTKDQFLNIEKKGYASKATKTKPMTLKPSRAPKGYDAPELTLKPVETPLLFGPSEKILSHPRVASAAVCARSSSSAGRAAVRAEFLSPPTLLVVAEALST